MLNADANMLNISLLHTMQTAGMTLSLNLFMVAHFCIQLDRPRKYSSDGCFRITASWSLETFVNHLFRNSGSEHVSNCQSHVISVKEASLCHYCFEILQNFSASQLGAISVNLWIRQVHRDCPPVANHWTSVYVFHLILDQFNQFIDIFNETFV